MVLSIDSPARALSRASPPIEAANFLRMIMNHRRRFHPSQAARFRPEPLEPRVQLSGAGNTVVAHAEYVVNRLSNRAEVRIEQLAAEVEARTVRFDAAYQAALANSAGGQGPAAFGRIDDFYLALERNVGRGVAEIQSQAAKVAHGSSPVEATIRAADPAAVARIDQTMASVGAALVGQVRSARAAAQAIIAPAHSAPGQATSLISAQARPALTQTAQSETASDNADIQGFLASLQQETTALLDNLATAAIQDSGSTGPTVAITGRSHVHGGGHSSYDTGIAYAEEGTYDFGTAFGVGHATTDAFGPGAGA